MAYIETIAHIKTDFPAKFGIPRQSGIVQDIRATVVFEPDYARPEAVRGLDGFSHIWLLWGFSENAGEGWSPTVRPPRLGGNTRVGVFASRSPYRPNGIGMSCVRLAGVDASAQGGPLLHVLGADLMDGTPIYDIKPYLPFTDSHPDAKTGYTQPADALLRVHMDGKWAQLLAGQAETVRKLLAQDPRPSYQHEAGRVYGMEYGGFNIRFTVDGEELHVVEVNIAGKD